MQPDELQAWFANVRTVLETAYLASKEPWKQSGMSGPAERLAELGIQAIGHRDGYDPIKGRKMRVAILAMDGSW